MAVVIRLQGLRITAGSEDVRDFFTGLKIPDGGVHIIGGEQEEAFIIFASDEDARRAMIRSGGCIRGSPVNLLLSSKSEMQSILEESTKNTELDQKKSSKENSRRLEMDVPVGARRPGHHEAGRRSGSRSGNSPLRYRRCAAACNDDLYLFLKGMPFSVTENEVSHFFHGLLVDGIILMKNARGQNTGTGLVKFASRQDAKEGLKRDRGYIGARFVEVYPATEDQWLEAGGNYGDVISNGKSARGKSPVNVKRHPQRRPRSRSPLAGRSSSPSNEEFCVMLENLSHSVEKRNIKELFRNARLQDDQILYLLGSQGRRTRSAFVLFKSLRDYCAALTHHKEEFIDRCVYISPISRDKMISILESHNLKDGQPERCDMFQEKPRAPQEDPYDSEKVCLYVRNMPIDVQKVEIMDFLGFNTTEDKVVLLHDQQGAGLGEALVVFQSEGEAMSAQSLNGQRLLGSEVMLKCISRSQMQVFGVDPQVLQGSMQREERYSARSNEAAYHPGDMEYPDRGILSHGKIPMPNLQVHIQGGSSFSDSYTAPYTRQGGGNGSFHGDVRSSPQNCDGPTCLKLVNLPSHIKIDEIYDFCYGYRVIPGSVMLQYDRYGMSKGSATVMMESRQEAQTAVKELSGRPIGSRKIQLLFE